MCAWCALLECVHDVQTFTFASISPDLLSAQVSRTAQDIWSLNFFIRHTAFWHIYDFLDTVYECMQTFIFAFTAHICRPSLLPQFLNICWVPRWSGLPRKFEVLTFSLGTRHFGTNFTQTFTQSFTQSFTAHICRRSLLPQFLRICWVPRWSGLPRTFQLLIFSLGTRQFGTFMNF